MSSFKIGEKEITSKDFHKQRQVINIFTIDINKVILSDRAPCNSGKDCRYIAGYQKEGETIIATAYLNARKTQPMQLHSVFLRQKSRCFSIKKFGMRLSNSCLKNSQQSLS